MSSPNRKQKSPCHAREEKECDYPCIWIEEEKRCGSPRRRPQTRDTIEAFQLMDLPYYEEKANLLDEYVPEGISDLVLSYLVGDESDDLAKKAIEQGNLEAVKYYISSGVIDLDSALSLASRHGHFPVVQYLVNQGANMFAKDGQALIFASLKGHLPIVQYLVESAPEAYDLYSRALIFASLKGHLPIVQYLVNQGADIYAKNGQALIFASENGHLPVVQYFMMSFRMTPSEINEALMAASVNGRLAVVKYLAENGASMRAKKEALLRAAKARGDHLPVVQYLVENGAADIRAVYDKALKGARSARNLSIIQYLEGM